MRHIPGEKVPHSGIYCEYNCIGVFTGKVTCVEGEPFPPTDGPDGYFELDRATSEDVALPLSDDAPGG